MPFVALLFLKFMTFHIHLYEFKFFCQKYFWSMIDGGEGVGIFA